MQLYTPSEQTNRGLIGCSGPPSGQFAAAVHRLAAALTTTLNDNRIRWRLLHSRGNASARNMEGRRGAMFGGGAVGKVGRGDDGVHHQVV